MAADGLVRFLRKRFALHKLECARSYDQLPAHIGIVFGSGSVELANVAQLVRWLSEVGICYLTLCDFESSLCSSGEELRAGLLQVCPGIRVCCSSEGDSGGAAAVPVVCSSRDRLEPGDTLPIRRRAHSAASVTDHEKAAETASAAAAADAAAVTSTKIAAVDDVTAAAATRLTVRIVSMHTGRSELVAVAKAMCSAVLEGKLSIDDIDEAQVERRLQAANPVPEVELVLQFCEETLLGGLPPWQCRNSHYIHMGRLREVTQQTVHAALQEYNALRQRHGS